MMEIEHPAPAGVTIYYWPCSLVLLAPTLVLNQPTSPMCATLRIACNAPYQIEVDGRTLETRASLVAPRVKRNRVVAVDSDIALIYLPVDVPEFAEIKTVLADKSIVELPVGRVDPFVPAISKAMRETLPAAEIKSLVHQVVASITGKPVAKSVNRDSRIEKACHILGDMPLSDVSPQVVANKIHLSASYLRELFKQEVGLTIGEYARWRAVWRAALYWKRGLKITEVAHHAGFHDLAHLDRAFNEVFGMNPSSIIDPRFVKLVNCE